MKEDKTLKNYIILILIFIFLIILTCVFKKVYNSYKSYKRSVPVLRGYVKELSMEELFNYINDNSDFIIYVSNSQKDVDRKLEKDLLKTFKNDEKFQDVLYLNINKYDKDFANKINKLSDLKINKTSPRFIYIENREVKDEIKNTKDKTIKKADVISFFNRNSKAFGLRNA